MSRSDTQSKEKPALGKTSALVNQMGDKNTDSSLESTTQSSSGKTDDNIAPNNDLDQSRIDDQDDAEWAAPRPAADRRLKVVAVLLGLTLLSLGMFSFGARIGKSRASVSPAGFGGRGGFGAGGFGGGGFGGGSGRTAGTTDPLAALLSPDPGANVAAPNSGTAPANPTMRGTISAITGSTFTITKADGTSIIVNLQPSTAIGKRTSAATSSLKQGDLIEVTGLAGTDGRLLADSVTIGDLAPAPVVTTSVPTSDTGAPATPTTTIAADLGGLLPG